MKKMSIVAALAVLASVALLVAFQQAPEAAVDRNDPLVVGFMERSVASVSDAVDQITGARGFLDASMRPQIVGANVPMKFVGRARTSQLQKAPADKATPALSAKDSVEMIDDAKPGEVGVIVVKDSITIAGIGGLMGTAAKSRGMAGVIVDGAVRDIGEVRGLGLPMFARGVAPSSSVGRWATTGRDIPVECAGVVVKPGDYIVAGEDGVVRVPADRAKEVLKRAQEIDERETKMVPYILKEKSLSKVVQIFNRI